EGYKKLQPLMPCVKMAPESSSEFSYQINRPRKSSVVEELKINRLCRWSVSAFMLQSITIGHSVLMAGEPTAIACRVEPDVNTDGARVEPLPVDRLPKLFRELLEISNEL